MLLLVCLLVPATVLAAEAEDVSGESEVAPSSSSAGGTVTDNHGNRYYVFGLSNRLGKTATVRTEYEVTYYYGGTPADVTRVNAYTKTLTARGEVSLSGGGANSFGGTVGRTGAKNSYSPSQTYIYNVTFIGGTHSFSCQGASWSRLTYM
jgi:hypothetical protein